MSITDFILPRWKHSNPNVRLKAIREMSTVNADILKEIALSDPDMDVRLEALNRIDGLEALQDILRTVNDEKIESIIRERLNSMYRDKLLGLKENDNELKQNVLEELTDEAILASLACELEDPGLRYDIVGRINAPELLCFIAKSNCGLKAGLLIVEKLSDPESLAGLSEDASNKKVKREAGLKRQRIIEEMNRPSPEEQLRIDLEEICGNVEKALETDDLEIMASTLEESVSAWNSLDPDNIHKLRIRFDSAKTLLEKRIMDIEARTKVLDGLEHLCRRVETILETLPNDAEIKVEEANNEWDAILEDRPADISEETVTEFEKRFDSLCDRFMEKRKQQLERKEQDRELFDRLDELCARFESLSREKWSEDSGRAWDEIKAEWDAAYREDDYTAVYKDRMAKAAAELENRRREKEEADRKTIESEKAVLIDMCERVEALIEAENRAGLEQTVKAVQKEWKEKGERVSDFKKELFPRFKQACNRFFDKQAEYWEAKDWERWANLNLKEELCDLLEELQKAPDVGVLAKAVNDSRNKWKEIGPVAREKSDEIWDRFRTACDNAYQICLDRKKALYEEARMLVDVDPDTINWKETTELIKYIQEEWNRIGFLPAPLEQEVRESFQDLCNRFFEAQRNFYRQMDQERNENLNQKKALLEEAESILGLTDWWKHAGKMKSLQQRWKETGPIPKKEGDDLWKQFRKTCNRFFEQLKAEKPENLRKKTALCEEAERLVNEADEQSDMEGIAQRLIELQREWKEIGPAPRNQSQEIWNRFRGVCDGFFSKRKERFKALEDENARRETEKERLIEAAEALCNSTNWRDTSERMKQLQREWKEIGPVSRKRERELWSRFNEACDTFFTRCKAFFEAEEHKRAENLEQKQRICLTLEVLAVVAMPEKELSYSDAAPMADQLSIALELKDELLASGDKKASWDRTIRKVKDLQAEWKETGPVPKKYDEALWKRYRRASNLFFNSRPAGDDKSAADEKSAET